MKSRRKIQYIFSSSGRADKSVLDQKREKEIYDSIVDAATFLMKAESSCLRFVDVSSGKTVKEIISRNKAKCVKNDELTKMPASLNVQKSDDHLIITTPQVVKDIKVYLVITGYDETEESNPKNLEILKVFVSQAIFLFSYAAKSSEDC